MNFNSYEFLLLFLPATLVVFHLVPPAARLPVLAGASLFFYGRAGITPLIFMLVSIVWGWATALAMHRFGARRSWLVAAVSVPLLILIVFKYMDFLLDSVGASQDFRTMVSLFIGIVLPAGISFYTFQIISYSVDVCDGKVEPEYNPLTLATYMSFFPHLVAGPILRYEYLGVQLARIAKESSLRIDWASGLKFLSIGLFGKVLVADVLGILVDKGLAPAFLASGTQSDTAFLILAYSFQIYFDFWSYSIMAIGLGKMIGIDLPANFLEPYISRSPKEFWRRWHVTLSYWLRDYVYLRIGGRENYARNIFVVFVLCGLWHGAGWNFVIWGAYHAVLVTGYHVSQSKWNRMPASVQTGLTFALVSLGWPLFFSDAAKFGQLLVKLGGFGNYGAAAVYSITNWIFLLMVGAFVFFCRERWWLYNETPRRILDHPATHAVLLSIAILFIPFSRTFIYFRF